MDRKKEEMLKKFEKLMKKGKLSKEDFYNQIFKDSVMGRTDSKYI
jgi:hypothetical protein